MGAKSSVEALAELERTLAPYLSRARTWRTLHLQAQQLLKVRDQEVSRHEAQQTQQKERNREVLWRLQRTLKVLDRLGVES